MNYQVELERKVKEFEEQGQVPTLLLHSCCAPCSTYVIEYLSQYFSITVYYYNPNIAPIAEYEKRAKEQQALITAMPTKYPVSFQLGPYENQKFYEIAKGLEKEPECGKRCDRCYVLRLEQTAMLAKELGVDYFTTTLTISPLKSAVKLNTIGETIGARIGVPYLVSDFKKKNGYKRSTELSKEYNLYRQNFCGCIYSKMEMEAKERNKNSK